MIIGGMKIAGCARSTATTSRPIARTRSAATAQTNSAAGSAGPCPIRALLRVRLRAARRCAAVSPGSR